jgi:hypothetical protein
MKMFKPASTSWRSTITDKNRIRLLTAYNADPIEGKSSDFLSTRHTTSFVDGKLWIWGGSKGFPPG